MRTLVGACAAVLVVVATVAAQTAPPAPPGHPPGGAMPPGHPPVRGAPPSIPPPPAGSGSGGQALTWAAPAGWIAEAPSSSMRRAQYRLDGPGGPGECVVFYFGPGQGGDAKANVARWVSQFRRPDGEPAGDTARTRELRVGGVAVTVVEVQGTYVGGIGGAPTGGDRPDHMLLGAIAAGPDANWFFRAIGPRATLETQRAAFDGLVRSIRRGASTRR